MRVLFFAQAAEIAGCRNEIWEEARPLTARQFWQKLETRHPGLQTLKSQCRIAVDRQFLASDGIIPPHSEVAVLPPVCGG